VCEREGGVCVCGLSSIRRRDELHGMGELAGIDGKREHRWKTIGVFFFSFHI